MFKGQGGLARQWLGKPTRSRAWVLAVLSQEPACGVDDFFGLPQMWTPRKAWLHELLVFLMDERRSFYPSHLDLRRL